MADKKPKKIVRREYLLEELRAATGKEQAAKVARELMGSDMRFSTVGFTFGGVQYRVYADAHAREIFKRVADMMDIAKGRHAY